MADMLDRQRYHYVDFFALQWHFAEAKYLEKKGIIQWASGHVQDDEATWYSNTIYFVKNEKAYDKFTKLIDKIHSNLKGEKDWNYGDSRFNPQYLLIIEKKLRRFRGRRYE